MPDYLRKPGRVLACQGTILNPPAAMLGVLLLLAGAVFTVPVWAQDSKAELDKDPFSQPDLLKYQPPVPQRQEEAEPAEQVIPELKLEATLLAGKRPSVIVNGTLLRRGQKIEGMRLIWVGPGQAVFRYGGKNHEYNLYEIETNETERR